MDTYFLIDLSRVLLAGLISGILVLRTIPTVNQIARSKGLLSIPGERTSHRYKTPNLAGISIFIAACISSLFFISDDFKTFNIVFLASIIIFFTGLHDDIVSISPWKKLLAQFVVAILIAMSGLRLENLFLFFGLGPLEETLSLVITISAIIAIVNAVNLIDGIDGLAAAIGTLILSAFGTFFFINGMFSWSIYCASMVGALLAFFPYNVFGLRNKTFMGDSGSLLLGLSVAVTTIVFWEANTDTELVLTFSCAPAIAIAVIIIPVFDTARIFFYRIIRHTSPFSADRNHLHHRLADLGLSHLQVTLILVGLNILMIGTALVLSPYMGMIRIVVVLFVLMTLFVASVNGYSGKKKKKENLENQSIKPEYPSHSTE